MTSAPVLPAAVVGALQLALQAEHAAIFGYAALGPVVSKAGRTLARTDEAAHRGRRNALLTTLTAAGVVPAASAAIYPAPNPLTSAAVAHRYGLDLETACCRQWRYVVAVAAGTSATTGIPTTIPTTKSATTSTSTANTSTAGTANVSTATVRADAVQALTACAVRAMRWRALLTPSTPTTAFPGI